MLAAGVSPRWLAAESGTVAMVVARPQRLTGTGMSVTEIDPSTESLLRRCAERDAVAFRKLYEIHAARLHGVALRITGQSALAADAVHDAFLQVWQQAARFDPLRGSPGAWLMSLVRYRAIDLVRKHGRLTDESANPERVDESPSPLERLLATRDGERLHRCMSVLDESQRRTILLAYVEGLSQTEIAARVAAPLGTVKSWMRRGLLALRECLAP